LERKVNSVNLFGHFGKDPELRYTETGKAVCNFRIAVNSGVGEKRTTEWLNCVAWAKTAEKVAEHGRKGKEIAIIGGRLQTRKWKDRDGNERDTTEVVANICVVGVYDTKETKAEPPLVAAGTVELEVDDIPF
jgi:single-strand DNA-binding protein